jgi:hypothetical protein
MSAYLRFERETGEAMGRVGQTLSLVQEAPAKSKIDLA